MFELAIDTRLNEKRLNSGSRGVLTSLWRFDKRARGPDFAATIHINAHIRVI
jgi:hypothetical protein